MAKMALYLASLEMASTGARYSRKYQWHLQRKLKGRQLKADAGNIMLGVSFGAVLAGIQLAMARK